MPRGAALDQCDEIAEVSWPARNGKWLTAAIDPHGAVTVTDDAAQLVCEFQMYRRRSTNRMLQTLEDMTDMISDGSTISLRAIKRTDMRLAMQTLITKPEESIDD
jgi:hypothetical protein